jgi:hypothetical protein
MSDYKNVDEPTANPKNYFRIEYFKVVANEIKSNSRSQFELFAKFVDKFCFCYELFEEFQVLNNSFLYF